MMSNQEAKNFVIKSHWENAVFNWNSISEHVNERGEIAVIDPMKFTASKQYKQAYEECLTNATGPFNGKYHYELCSLVGVEKNNGWTRIEPDGSNLPKTNCLVDIVDNGKEYRVYFNALTKEFTDQRCWYNPSHFDIVQPRALPRW